jgi:hypothetical protein
MPLAELHRRLCRELGDGAGPASVLALDLERDPAFRISDPADPLGSFADGWPPEVRQQYRAALLGSAHAGLRVHLNAPPPPHEEPVATDPLDVLDLSLDILEAATREPLLVGRLAEARAEYGALRHAVALAQAVVAGMNAPHHHSSSMDSASTVKPAS